MKKLFLSIAFLYATICASAQCTPDPQYSNSVGVLFPDSIDFVTNDYATAGMSYQSVIDLKTFTDTVVSAAGFTVLTYLDGFKIHEVNGAPAGFTFTGGGVTFESTDPRPDFGQSSVDSVWWNDYLVPNDPTTLQSVQGCIQISASSSSVAAAAPATGFIDYPIEIVLDSRVAATDPPVPFLIQNGTWLSDPAIAALTGPLVYTQYVLRVYANQPVNQCSPDLSFYNNPIGLYPAVSADCGFTFTSVEDTVINVQTVGDVTFYLDAFRLTNASGIPSGVALTTNVIGTADQDGPYGYWYNTGVAPNQSRTQGCVSFEENGTLFSSLTSSGPNSNGTYPVTFNIDARIAGTSPDISFVVPAGTWLSELGALGISELTTTRVFDVNSCVAPGPCSTPPSVLFARLNTSYAISDNPATLVGAPSGGTFFGPGMSGNQFDPSAAGLGTHGITYVYEDQNDCLGAYALCTTVNLSVGGGGTEIASTEGLDVYPNPSNGRFNLKVDGFDGVVSYTVYDAYGKEVGFNSFVANGLTNESIDLSELAIGAYTIQVQTSKGLYSEKLILQ